MSENDEGEFSVRNTERRLISIRLQSFNKNTQAFAENQSLSLKTPLSELEQFAVQKCVEHLCALLICPPSYVKRTLYINNYTITCETEESR